MLNRDAYIAKMKLQLDELNKTMAELELKSHEAKEEMRERYNAEIGQLHHQSQLAMGKLDELKTASEDSWKQLVAESEKIRDAFINSFHYFKSQI